MYKHEEESVINRIKKLHKSQRAYAGLVDPKFVNIRGHKRCACCNNIILSGQRALTSSMPVDKKYGINFTYAYNNNCVKEHKFVLERQWMHPDCAVVTINEAYRVDIKDVWYKRMSFDDIDLSKVDDEEALDIIRYFHSKGEISNSEYQSLEDAYIDSIAFRDAMGIGQE